MPITRSQAALLAKSPSLQLHSIYPTSPLQDGQGRTKSFIYEWSTAAGAYVETRQPRTPSPSSSSAITTTTQTSKDSSPASKRSMYSDSDSSTLIDHASTNEAIINFQIDSQLSPLTHVTNPITSRENGSELQEIATVIINVSQWQFR